MTNYNLSEIMTTANTYRRDYNLTMSEALRAAWLGAKIEKLDKAIDLLSYCDRFTPEQKASDDSMRTERNSLMAAYRSIIPATQNAVTMDWNALYALKDKMEMDYYRKGEMKEYCRIRRMSISEFKAYVQTMQTAA